MSDQSATNVVGWTGFLPVYMAVSKVLHWEVMGAAWQSLNASVHDAVYDSVKDAAHNPELTALQVFLGDFYDQQSGEGGRAQVR